jgi:3-dehydroquinate dehydratase II
MVWLGKREPEFYGTTTAAELDAMLLKEAAARNLDLRIRYTNIEGKAINWIYEAASNGTEALLMNPAGFSTAGFALRDCLKAVRGLPYVEIHITNVEARGIRPVTSGEADGVIAALASTLTSWHWAQSRGYWQGRQWRVQAELLPSGSRSIQRRSRLL